MSKSANVPVLLLDWTCRALSCAAALRTEAAACPLVRKTNLSPAIGVACRLDALRDRAPEVATRSIRITDRLNVPSADRNDCHADAEVFEAPEHRVAQMAFDDLAESLRIGAALTPTAGNCLLSVISHLFSHVDHRALDRRSVVL